MRKFGALLLAVMMGVSLAACGGSSAPAAAPAPAAEAPAAEAAAPAAEAPAAEAAAEYTYNGPRMTIGGADSTGTMYAAAAAVATTFSNNINGLSVDATTSSGSNENALNVHEGEIELGMCSGDAALNAWNGVGKFADTGECKDIRAIGAVYPSLSNWVALKSTGYKYLHDAKDDHGTFGCGPAASTSETSARLGLKVSGITEENATLKNVTLGDGADEVCNGTMTASTGFSGVPLGVHLNASVTKDCVWLGFTEEELDQICAENPAYYKAVIPAGTYNGQDEDVPTFGVKCMVICNESLDYDLAYNMAKAFYEQAEEMIKGNAFFYNMADREFICNDLPIPLHPGAEAFYKEIGVLK